MSLSEITINEKLSWRDVNDELVALDVVTGEYHVFNDIGRKIWLHLADQQSDLEGLIAGITHEYNAQAEEVSADIHAFVNDLVERGLLINTEKGA